MIISKIAHRLKARVEYLYNRIDFNGLWCRLTHKIVNHGQYFTDMVNGKVVNLYTCQKCKKSYMAYSKRALFRVYTANTTPTPTPTKRKIKIKKIKHGLEEITKEGYRP